MAAGFAGAQSDAQQTSPIESDNAARTTASAGSAPSPALEAYLERLGLDELLADHLFALATSDDESIAGPAARRLADVYTRLLEHADEARAGEVLESISRFEAARPDAVTIELRLIVTTTEFRELEPEAERARLGLISPERERELASQMQDIAQRMGQYAVALRSRVADARRRERATALRSSAEDAAAELAEARRRSSACEYYAGWAYQHHGALTGQELSGTRAVEFFATVLDLSGEEPTLDRVPQALLRYDHVARAALGVGLGLAIAGQTEDAVLWMREITDSEQVSPAVRQQARVRLCERLLRDWRWSEADIRITELRQAAGGVLTPADARLVALHTMGALADTRLEGRPRDVARDVASRALADLVSRGEVGQVLDLFRRFGSLPGLGDGFVGRYVQGIERYEQARTAQIDAGESPGVPSRASHVSALYAEAARMLGRAAEAQDAAELPRERAGCLVLRGRALLGAGQPMRAGDAFTGAAEGLTDPEAREEAIWMSVVAYDAALTAGDESARAKRDAQAEVYLEGDPRSDRAGALVLRMASEGTVDAERGIDVLRRVPRDAPVARAAERLLASMLFAEARDAVLSARDPYADEFYGLAERLNAEDEAQAIAGDEAAASALLLRLRQQAELAFILDPARTDEAAQALDAIRRLAERGVVSLDGLEGELRYRDLRLAMEQGDDRAADESLDALRAQGGPFAMAGMRQAFARSYAKWRLDQANTDLAARVVRLGQYVVDEEEPTTAWAAAVREQVAQVAEAHWRVTSEQQMLEIAMRLDRSSVTLGTAGEATFRRLAQLAASRGEQAVALDAWIRCMRVATPGSDGWYEARYESLAILAESEPDRAVEALRQLVTLYPNLGGDRWRERFEALCTRFGIEIPEETP